MHQIAKGAALLGACLMLTGCPEVTKVEGSATGYKHPMDFLPGQLAPGDDPMPGSKVHLDPGASVTMYDFDYECERTFTSDFVVPRELRCERKQQEQEQEQQASQQESPAGENGTPPAQSGIVAPEPMATPGAPYSSYVEGAGNPQPQPGLMAPEAQATIAPTGVSSMGNVVSVLQNVLTVVGAVTVAKEIHDQTDGNKKDKPISQ